LQKKILTQANSSYLGMIFTIEAPNMKKPQLRNSEFFRRRFFLSLACNTGDSRKMAFSFSGRYYALLLLELGYVHPGLAASHYRLLFSVKKQNGKFWSWVISYWVLQLYKQHFV
jgi:hypothetical protein